MTPHAYKVGNRWFAQSVDEDGHMVICPGYTKEEAIREWKKLYERVQKEKRGEQCE